MYPTLLRWNNFEIRSYGVMFFLSFVSAVFYAMHRADKKGISHRYVFNLSILLLVCAFWGSRLFYVLTHINRFRGRWWDVLNPFQSSGMWGLSGFAIMGGLLLVMGVGILFLRLWRLPILRIADILTPPGALIIFIARIGCFLAGCCYGIPTKLSIGVKFPPLSPAGTTFPNIPIHPTQIYSSLSGLAILGILLYLERRKRFEGFLFFSFLILFGIARFTIEMVRVSRYTMVMLKISNFLLSWNQGIAFVLVIAGIIGIVYKFRYLKMERKTYPTR